MHKQVSTLNKSGFSRIELVQEFEGVYIFIYERAESKFPEQDYLADDVESAKTWCAEDYGVPVESWVAGA